MFPHTMTENPLSMFSLKVEQLQKLLQKKGSEKVLGDNFQHL